MDDQFKPNSTPSTSPDSPENQTPTNSTGSNAAAPNQPAAQVINPTGPAKPKRNLLKWLVPLIILIVAAVAAYLGLNKVNKTPQPATQSSKKSVSLLRIGISQPFPTAFYPGNETAVFPIEVNAQIFEGLTQFANENQVVPNLATSWTNPNNTTWDFKLAQGVKFHDGNLLTPQIVKASLDALQSTPYGQQFGSTIKTVTAKDNQTVEIATNTPDPLLPTELANLWIYDTTSGKTNDPGNGTGPYTLKPGTQLTANSLDLVAVNDYHGGTPMTKELQFKYYTDSSAESSDLQKGLLDISDSTVQSPANQSLPTGYKIYADKNPQVYFLTPNTRKASSPLSKLAVRKAIYEALDPLAIMKADGRSGSQATQLVPQEIPGYNPSVTPPKTDPTQAKADLAAAGYPNGFTFALTYLAPQHQAMAQEVQKELAAIGVKVTLDGITDGPTVQKKALSGQTDMFYFGYSSGLIDSSDVIGPVAVNNPNFDDPNIDKLYAQASTTFDNQTRLQLLQQLNKMVMDDVALFPLFTPDALNFAVKNNLVINTDNLTNYMGVDFWKVYSQ
jgi:peptide/nickel transport system substrate-binding protein